MIIDATDLILGRFATHAAKKALLGEKVDIINCEKAVITGRKKYILSEFKRKREQGIPARGPFYPRQSDRIVKRAVRGMLPYKKDRGAKALKMVVCHTGVPEKLKDQKAETIEGANISKVPNLKYLSIGQISKELGA